MVTGALRVLVQLLVTVTPGCATRCHGDAGALHRDFAVSPTMHSRRVAGRRASRSAPGPPRGDRPQGSGSAGKLSALLFWPTIFISVVVMKRSG